jgi:hypothetical protein
MSIYGVQVGVPCNWPVSSNCGEQICPDFTIKRHDTQPSFKVSVEDCDGPVDFDSDLYVIEANMWAKGKLKKALTASDAYFALADNIGFNQIMVGDIIVMDRIRLPERMLVTGFDETNKLVQVQRGYQGSTIDAYPKGNVLRIFRTVNATATWENQYADIEQADGTTATHQLIASFLEYAWTANDTCLPGDYWLEFKLLKMLPVDGVEMVNLPDNLNGDIITMPYLSAVPSIIPSFTPSGMTSQDYGCVLGEGVEWVRRYPADREAFLIRIVDSPTAEL